MTRHTTLFEKRLLIVAGSVAIAILALSVWNGSLRRSHDPSVAAGETIESPDLVGTEADLVTVGDRREARSLVVAGAPEPLDDALLLEGPDGMEVFEEVTSTATSVASPPWDLHLTIAGEVDAEPAQVQIRVRMDGDPFVSGRLTSTPCPLGVTIAVPIGSLLEGNQRPGTLMLEATHPSLHIAPTIVTVVSPDPDAEGIRPTIRAEMTAEPGFGAVGRVTWAEQSLEEAAVASTEVIVAAWPMEDGVPKEKSVSSTSLDADGSFILPLPTAGRYYLAAHDPGRCPVGQAILVSTGSRTVDVGVLTFDAGATISGRFVLNGRTPPHAVAFGVNRNGHAGKRLALPGSIWEKSGLAWTHTSLDRLDFDSESKPDGSFEVHGLSPGPYRLQARGLTAGHQRLDIASHPVHAPSSGLEIELGFSTLRITLESADSKASPAEGTLVIHNRTAAASSNVDGVIEEEEQEPVERIECRKGLLHGSLSAEFYYEPLTALTVEYQIDGHTAALREVVTPAAGGHSEVVLTVQGQARASASLRIKLDGEHLHDGEAFKVHVAYRRQDNVPLSMFAVHDSHDYDANLLDGALHLKALEPGAATILLYRGTWGSQRPSHELDARGDVHLRPDAESELTLELEHGGRLVLGQRNGDDGWRQASCTVQAEDGTPVPVTFIAFAPDGSGAVGMRGTLPDLNRSQVIPNLAPGSYIVQIGEATRTIELTAGQTVEWLAE